MPKKSKKKLWDRDFKWLKKMGSLDKQGEKAIKQILKQYQNVLIVGGEGAGKNTWQNACLSHFYQLNKNPAVLPSMNVTSLPTLFRNKMYRKFRQVLNLNTPAIFAVSHKSNTDNLEYYMQKFHGQFDAIIDVRKTPNGKRFLYQVLVKTPKSWRATYLNEKYLYKYDGGLLAA